MSLSAIPSSRLTNDRSILSGRRPTIRTSRVNQLDADLLDEELQHLLFEPFWSTISSILRPHHHHWRLEFSCLLKFILLRFSLQKRFSYGAQLQNLKLIDLRSNNALSQTQMTIYSLLAVLPSYLRTRFRDYMISSGWAEYPRRSNHSDRSSIIYLLSSLSSRPSEDGRIRRNRRFLKRFVWDLFERFDQIYASLELLNYIMFLINGRYRSLLERLLGIGFVYDSLDVRRNVSFEFLNRQLVWESITDFVLFLLPLINFRRVRLRLLNGKSKLMDWLKKVLSSDNSTGSHSTFISSSGEESKKKKEQTRRGRFHELSNELCPICVTKRIYKTRTTMSSNVLDPNDPMTFSSSTINNSNNHNGSIHDHLNLDKVKLAYQVNCCQGLYCYYCLISEMIIWRETNLDQRWICWRCGKETTSIDRWDGS